MIQIKFYKKTQCSPFRISDREKGMHWALWLFLNLSSGLFCEIGILIHPGTLLGHGALLVPHPSVWLETVNVKSWSINDPHSMVMWVKFGSKPPTFSEVFTNTVLLIVLAFLSASDGFVVEASRGPSMFWKEGGTKRANAVSAEPYLWRYEKIILTKVFL